MSNTVTIVVSNYGADEGEAGREVLELLDELDYIQDREIVMEDGHLVRLNVTLTDSEAYGLMEDEIDGSGMKCEFIN